MASEQTGRMNRSIDSRADLYSWGTDTLSLSETQFVANEAESRNVSIL
jgi:hypothetical protein